MSHLLAYYSHGGKVANLCRELAHHTGVKLLEIKPVKQRGALATFFAGGSGAASCKAWEIEPVEEDVASFDEIYIAFPVWAGHLSPPMNAFLRTSPIKGIPVTCIAHGLGENPQIGDYCKAEIEKNGAVYRKLIQVTSKEQKAGTAIDKIIIALKG